MTKAKVPTMKACQRCAELKPAEAFPTRFDKGHEGSRRNVCRDCANSRTKDLKAAAADTKVCLHCSQRQPLEEYPVRYDRAATPGSRRNVCRACINRRNTEIRNGVLPSREIQRKLPKYEVLKRLVVEKGMSYQDIATKYKVNKRAVYGTLKRRAELRGEWPLVSEADAKRRARRASYEHWKVGNGNTVNASFLAEALREHLETVEQPRVFVCSKKAVYPPGSYEQWSVLNGFNRAYIREMLNKQRDRVMAAYAVRIYQVIGEEVPDWLAKSAAKRADHSREAPHVTRERRALLAKLAALMRVVVDAGEEELPLAS